MARSFTPLIPFCVQRYTHAACIRRPLRVDRGSNDGTRLNGIRSARVAIFAVESGASPGHRNLTLTLLQVSPVASSRRRPSPLELASNTDASVPAGRLL